MGTGFMARTHLEAWRHVEGGRVVAVASRSMGRARELASQYGVEAIEGFDKALLRDDVDAVDICTPTHTHREFVEAAAESGKHIVLEKPISTNLEDADKIISKARRAGVRLMVAHVLRYFPEYVEAWRMVRNGELGEPLHARASRKGAFPAWAEWYGDPEKSGGVEIDLAIHDIDYLRWVLGEVESVYARLLNVRGRRVHDHALILLRFRNGALAHVEASWAMPKTCPFTMTLEIYGSKAMVAYSNLDGTPITVSRDDSAESHSPITLPYSASILPFPIDPYRDELQDFVNLVLGEGEPRVRPEEARESLRICLAARESSKRGEEVRIL